MPPNYTSVEAKLRRAEEHFELVHAEIDVWIKSGSYTFALEVNSDQTRHALVAVQHGPSPDYLRWTLILGDCINNLRCALDHLVYVIAKYQTINNPSANIDLLAFVIADFPKDFAEWSKRKLKWLTSPVVDSIEAVQPYNRPHSVVPPLLEILRGFSNADKHRLLRLASGGTVSANLKFESPFRFTPKVVWNPDPIEDNSIICLVESPQPNPEFRFDPSSKFGMEVCLWHGLRKGEPNAMYQRTDIRFSFLGSSPK